MCVCLIEPGTNEEIEKFARAHGAEYDLFAKIKVNGEEAAPVYQFLKQHQNVGRIDV